MKEKVIEILNGLRPEFDFSKSSNFIEEGLLDSFDIVTLVTELEDNFGITIDGEDVIPDNFNSVMSIVSLIKKSEKNS